MAVERHRVEYEGGLVRHKNLSREDAEKLGDQKGVKSVRKDTISDKQRRPAQNKAKDGDQ